MDTGTVIAVVAILGGVWLVWRWLVSLAWVTRLVLLVGAGWMGWQWWDGPTGPRWTGSLGWFPTWALAPVLAVLSVFVIGFWVSLSERAANTQVKQEEKIGTTVKS